MKDDKPVLVDVTPAAMRNYAEHLEAVAGFHRKIADMMAESGVNGVHAGNIKTGISGLISLSNFTGQVVKALVAEKGVDALAELYGAVEMFELARKRERRKLDNPDSPQASVQEMRAARHAKGDTEREQKGKKPGKRG